MRCTSEVIQAFHERCTLPITAEAAEEGLPAWETSLRAQSH